MCSRGTIGVSATEQGRIVLANPNDRNSLFTQELVKNISKIENGFRKNLKETFRSVYEKSSEKQMPFVLDKLEKDIFFESKITDKTFVQIFWKTDPFTTKSNTATIKSIISGNAIKPEQIKILVNGKSQNGQKLGETSLKSNQNRYDWQGVVSLQEGENEIVLAIQQPNQAEVRCEQLIIRYEEPTKPLYSIGRCQRFRSQIYAQ
jgi:hypothetical protein